VGWTGLAGPSLRRRARGFRPAHGDGGRAPRVPPGPQGHVSYERVCSGIGIVNIYRFLRDKGHAKEPERLTKALAGVSDPVPVIVEKALDPENPCDICVRALELFASILGAEAGNLGLKIMATGGVYLGGGIPPRILPLLKENHFTEAFLRKGRMRNLMARIPVHVIMNAKAALLGAAALGLGSETGKRSRSSR
jgi:glucokinase